jgi:DNA-binding transcriptional MerR regulator
MEQYSLSDIERITGIKSDTIRMWEKRYRITIPGRSSTNRKWYSGEDLRRLINISILNQNGIKISQIAALSAEALEEKAAAIATNNRGPEVLFGKLTAAMINFDEEGVNEILLRSVINSGFEQTFTSLVFPFLNRVGVLWHTGTIKVAHEHFISNLFRRRLIAAFENLTPLVTPKSKKILLFLPENEYHELGLIYYGFIARKSGNRVLYLGQSTPLKEVFDTCESWKPEIIITGTLSGLSVKDNERFVGNLSGSLPGIKIILAGSLAPIAEKKKFRNVFACRSDSDLRSFIR